MGQKELESSLTDKTGKDKKGLIEKISTYVVNV